jgi:hypothetical protein
MARLPGANTARRYDYARMSPGLEGPFVDGHGFDQGVNAGPWGEFKLACGKAGEGRGDPGTTGKRDIHKAECSALRLDCRDLAGEDRADAEIGRPAYCDRDIGRADEYATAYRQAAPQ